MKSLGFKANLEAIENSMINTEIDVERQSILYHVGKCREAYQKLEKRLKRYKKESLTPTGLKLIGLNKKAA